jgi:small-conductance mechanosensitive channel
MVKILGMVQDESKIEEVLKEDVWENVKSFLNQGLHIGSGDKSIHLTIGILLTLVLAFLLANLLLKWLRHFFTRNMVGDDKLKFINIFRFIRYFVYLAVILLTMSAAGIDITLLITASAVLFVGLGLALQDLFQDIIGGIYIILDKSLRVGDIIELDGKVGKVFEIELRSTRALTRDDKVIIVPNHKFITDIVFNHTQNHKTTRESIAVGVAYGSDVHLVTDILLECTKAESRVAKNPEPFVLFDDFGDSALLFSVHFFIIDSFLALKIKSNIRYAIDDQFRKKGITIPFPQRDVHFSRGSSVQPDEISDPNNKSKN